MYFPVAGIEVSFWIPPVVAFTISLFTSIGGISGAFLIMPFQVSILGFTSPAVSATNQVFNVVATPGGVYRYIREGRMVWPLACVIIIGTLPGVFIGAIIRVKYLPDPVNFKLFVGLVLLYIGSRLVKDLIKRERSKKNQSLAEDKFHDKLKKSRKTDHFQSDIDEVKFLKVTIRKFNLRNIIYDFSGQTFYVNVIAIMSLCFVVGIIGGVYGIGGGAIIAPFLVSFFALPVYTIAGVALMGTFVTSVAGVFFYQMIAPFYPDMVIAPDWALGLLFGLGGFAGMYCGARLQKHIPASLIKWILVAFILFPAIKYIYAFIENI